MKVLLIPLLILSLAVGAAQAATKGRIMTNGKVSMYKNGKLVNSFTEQGPLDENSLIACDGTCMVKLKGISLLAADNTTFAVRESDETVNLYVDKGKVNFAISDVTRQFSFYTPDGYFIRTEGFIAPASNDSSVKGFMRVTDTASEIGMEEGTMIAQTDDGTQSIGPGQAILLAMAEVPDEENNTDDKAALIPCPFFSWGCKTAAQQLGIIGAGGALAIQGGLIVYWNSQDDDKTLNLSQPAEPPASPNR